MSKSLWIFYLIMILGLAACGGEEDSTDDDNATAPGSTTPTSAPVSNTFAELTINGRTSLRPPNCLGTHSTGGVQVFVWNNSTADIIGDFLFTVDGVEQTVNSLAAGEVKDFFVPASTAPGAQFQLVVDPDNRVPEIDENNNTFAGTVMTLTPPPACTATPQP